MSQTPPTLHLVFGKPASGKSTLTARLGQSAGTIVISEDAWLAALFGDQMHTLADYQRCAARLRASMAPHIVDLLRAGLSVVLDFPANTVETRTWMRGLIDTSQAAHLLHYLDVPDDVCKARLRVRNAQGEHPFSLTDAQFDRLTRHIVAPTEDEGFTILHHRFDPNEGAS